MVQIDIQMPSDCYSCWVRKNIGCKIANDSGWLNNKRDDNCPLKEQEAKSPVVRKKNGYWDYVCPTCESRDEELFREWNYCPYCGQAVKWK